MALAFYRVVPRSTQNNVTSGTGPSHQTDGVQVTWDDTEIVTKLDLLTHLQFIEEHLQVTDDVNAVTNGSDPRGYLIPHGGQLSDVVFRNATADTVSVLDGAGAVALEGLTTVDVNKNVIIDTLQVLKTAIVKGIFPIA